MQRYGAVVVGLGAHGSAALYHLAQRLGGGVLGLEAQPAVAHSQGSSHGLSRIIRLAYQEHPDYTPLLRSAYRLWRELEAETGQVGRGGGEGGTARGPRTLSVPIEASS